MLTPVGNYLFQNMANDYVQETLTIGLREPSQGLQRGPCPDHVREMWPEEPALNANACCHGDTIALPLFPGTTQKSPIWAQKAFSSR